MSEAILAPVLTVALLVSLLLWVPALHLCSHCRQSLWRRRTARAIEPAAAPSQATEEADDRPALARSAM